MRRENRRARERITHAYQTANLQGAKRHVLDQLLEAVGQESAAAAQKRPATPEQLMTVMARWRVAMAEVGMQSSRKSRRRGR